MQRPVDTMAADATAKGRATLILPALTRPPAQCGVGRYNQTTTSSILLTNAIRGLARFLIQAVQPSVYYWRWGYLLCCLMCVECPWIRLNFAQRVSHYTPKGKGATGESGRLWFIGSANAPVSATDQPPKRLLQVIALREEAVRVTAKQVVPCEHAQLNGGYRQLEHTGSHLRVIRVVCARGDVALSNREPRNCVSEVVSASRVRAGECHAAACASC